MSLTDSELSALVAEKVMGLIPCQSKMAHDPASDYYMGPAEGNCYAHPENPSDGSALEPFATDDGLALRAALKENSQICITEYGDGHFSVSNSDFSSTATGSTLARALCLAALRAVGEEVEDDE